MWMMTINDDDDSLSYIFHALHGFYKGNVVPVSGKSAHH